MKKIVLLLAFGLIFNVFTAAQASAISEKALLRKHQAEVKKELKLNEKEIRNCFDEQLSLSNRKQYSKLKEYYAEKYRNSDAFDRNTTFRIIKDNYDMYPNLYMSSKINSVNITGDYATVDINEYAEASGIKRDDLELYGELKAFAHTIYYLEKTNGKWLITAERAIEENNIISFGEAKYFDITLSSPMIVHAGESYSSVLKVNNLPQNAVLTGSITQSQATFPLDEEEDMNSYRTFDDTLLERIFTANQDNINEYNFASLGITRGQPLPNGRMKLYLSGLAFVMTRVNVIPENKIYTPAEEIVEETPQKETEVTVEEPKTKPTEVTAEEEKPTVTEEVKAEIVEDTAEETEVTEADEETKIEDVQENTENIEEPKKEKYNLKTKKNKKEDKINKEDKTENSIEETEVND